MKPIVELKNVSAGYEGAVVLENASFEVNAQDFIGVIGPNGGGKTTLIKTILGLLKPYSGEVIYHTDKSNLFGYLPQNNPIDNHFPIYVEEVVLSGLLSKKGLFRRYNKADIIQTHTLLEQYGMLEYRKRTIGELSGGQLQRVLLCRAVISSPCVLILDEPTTFVDSHFEKEFYPILKELNKTISIIMVSHDLGTICSYVKSIICVNRQLHHHHSNLISKEQLEQYSCPLELLTHGDVPHRVLSDHE